MFFNGKRNGNGGAENRAGLKPKARPYNDNGGKNRNRLPPKVLRLKQRPVVCFL